MPNDSILTINDTFMLMDSMPFPYYAIDFETSELLFINAKMRELAGIATFSKGAACHQLLFHRDTPCEHCPRFLNNGDEHSCRFLTQNASAQFQVYTNSLTDSSQRKIFTLQACDITSQIQDLATTKALAHRRIFIANISKDLLCSQDAQAAIREALENICAFFVCEYVGLALCEGPGTPMVISAAYGTVSKKEAAAFLRRADLTKPCFHENHRLINPIHFNGELIGAFVTMYQDHSKQWLREDCHLCNEIAQMLATVIHSQHLQTQIASLQTTEETAQATLTGVINNLPGAVFWKNAVTGVYEGCNSSFIGLINVPRDQVIGRTNEGVFKDQTLHSSLQSDEAALRSLVPVSSYEPVCFDGVNKLTVHITKTVLRDAGGTPYRIVGLLEDVTETLRLRQEADDSLEKLEVVMDNYAGIVLSIDENRIINVRGGVSVFGITKQDTLNQHLHKVYRDYPVVIDCIEKAFKGSQQSCLLERGGNVARCTAIPIYGHKGRVVTVLFFGHNMTEHYRLQRQLEETLQVAYEASRAKSDFLARMSHEIRTPMNAIMGMTRIAKDTADSLRIAHCLDQIHSASSSLLELINQILDMSKIEANKLEIAQEPFDLRHMIAATADMMRTRMDEKQQQFIVSINLSTSAAYIGDELRISQVLINLLSNANKFTPARGFVRMAVTEASPLDGLGEITFAISDNGVGIDPTSQERVFDSFEQEHTGISRSFGGTGLGLAICKQLVELMGGAIYVDSKPGLGSTFSFTIPLKRHLGTLHTQPSAHVIETAFLDQFIHRHGGKTVLVVEDVEMNREIVLAFLEDTHLNVLQAANGQEAVNLYQQSPQLFSAILMDMQMPVMDGLTATAHIRAIGADMNLNTPIIAMTANAFEEDVRNCLKAGMNAHLAKPISKELLLQALLTHMPYLDGQTNS